MSPTSPGEGAWAADGGGGSRAGLEPSWCPGASGRSPASPELGGTRVRTTASWKRCSRAGSEDFPHLQPALVDTSIPEAGAKAASWCFPPGPRMA